MGLSKPDQLVERAEQLELEGVAITDYCSLGGAVDIIKECKPKGIKPIIGCEIPVFHDNRFGNITLIAKNLKGWSSLCEILYKACPNGKPSENFTFETLATIGNSDLILIDGGGSESNLANHIFLNHDNILEREKFAHDRLRSDYETAFDKLISVYKNNFGKENIFIGVDLFDIAETPGLGFIADVSRTLASGHNIKTVMMNSTYYCTPEEFEDHRICLTIGMKKSLQSIYKNIREGKEQEHRKFFVSDKFYIPSFKSIKDRYRLSEIENTKLIGGMCDAIDLKSKQRIPKFCENSNEALTALCREGWLTKLSINTPEQKKLYGDRIRGELETIKGAIEATSEYGNLSDYFLIVHDYVRAAHSRGELTGIGRGSGGGCLINFLLGITGLDPVKYGLLFERFYNAGRNTKDNVELPDIDVDFEAIKKPNVVKYLKSKWGEDCVAQICNFAKMKGRSALTDVFSKKTNLPFNRIKTITEFVPDESKISDQLQDMMEETGESSIIRWALENNSKQLEEWCFIDDKGNLEGEFAKVFAQAIRLEGTIRSRGRHASGIVISSTPLKSICPLWTDSKSGELVTGKDMKPLGYMGIPKFDILGLSTLDKMGAIVKLVQDRYREGVYG